MSVLIQSKATVTPATSASLSFNPAPTGIQVGDTLICHYGFNDATDTMNTLSGWTHEINNAGAGGNTKTGLQWKIADSGDAAAGSFTFNLTGTASSVGGGLLRINGNIITDLLNDAAQLQGNTGNPTYSNTVTPLSTSALLLLFITSNDSGVSPAVSGYAIANNNPTWNEEYDLASSNILGIALASAQYTAGTATGNSSATITGTGTQDSYGMLVAISAPISVSISPAVLSVIATVQSPSVTGGAIVSPSVISVAANVQSPAVTTPASEWTNEDKTSGETFTNQSKT